MNETFNHRHLKKTILYTYQKGKCNFTIIFILTGINNIISKKFRHFIIINLLFEIYYGLKKIYFFYSFY